MSRNNGGPLVWALLSTLAMYLALSSRTTHAQPVKIAPRMSGQMLVDQYLGPPGSTAGKLSGPDFVAQQAAKGYLDGIHDATEGRVWCYSGRIKPHELNFSLVWSLKDLPKETLKGNAAPLVVSLLSKKYPCPNSN
jgi:Rap1a immunity proteins